MNFADDENPPEGAAYNSLKPQIGRAKLGQNGKYYCGKRVPVNSCRCCNGSCGPDDGCNCSDCMKLDIQSRRLPRGSLLNKDGRVATQSRKNGRFYCQDRTRQGGLNGICGPNDGPNCTACSILDTMAAPGGPYSTLI